MGSRKKHKLNGTSETKKQAIDNKKHKKYKVGDDVDDILNKRPVLPKPSKPAKTTRAPLMTTKLIDPITGDIVQTVKTIEQNKKLNPLKNILNRPIKRMCPARKPRVQQNTTDMCIADEKTKPWIKNFHGTLIQLGPDQRPSKLFADFLIKDESKEYQGWYTPSDNFYSILCKANEHFLPIQKGQLLTIKTLDSLPSDMQLSSSEQNSITVKVANIVDEPYLINFPQGVKGQDNKWLLPENNDYISARKNYLNTKLSADDSAIDDLLSMSYSKLFQESAMNESIKFKISQYLNNFSTKVPDSVLEEYSKIIKQDARAKQLSLSEVLTMLVKSTLFLRNEFDMINQNLIVKIRNNIIKPKQVIEMNQDEILPELYQNPELDIQIKRDELYIKLNKLVDETVRNLAINILLYKMNIDRSKFWTQNRNLKQSQEDIHPFSLESGALTINDIIPLQNLCATKVIQEHGKQITLDDIDELGGVIFYKDIDGQLYCFTLGDIKNISSRGETINPLSGKPFLTSFLDTIKKLNLEQVSGANYINPWHPSAQLALDLFGDDDDDDDDPWSDDDAERAIASEKGDDTGDDGGDDGGADSGADTGDDDEADPPKRTQRKQQKSIIVFHVLKNLTMILNGQQQ